MITFLNHSLNDVILSWVSAHRGIASNEPAHETAKIALRHFLLLNILIPIEDFKRYTYGTVFPSQISLEISRWTPSPWHNFQGFIQSKRKSPTLQALNDHSPLLQDCPYYSFF